MATRSKTSFYSIFKLPVSRSLYSYHLMSTYCGLRNRGNKIIRHNSYDYIQAQKGSSSTISGSIKTILNASEINSSLFKALLTRSASAEGSLGQINLLRSNFARKR